MRKRFKIVLPVLLLIVFCVTGLSFRARIKQTVQDFLKQELPQAKQASEFVNKSENAGNPQTGDQEDTAKKTVKARKSTDELQDSKTQPPTKQVKSPEISQPVEFAAKSDKSLAKPLPDAINLKIPFAPQAPFADWSMPYQEACEEAAAIMTYYYFSGKQNLDPATMDMEILKLIDWENATFGYYQDTTAEEIARILREYFKFENVEVKYDNFTIEDIKSEVALGNPVILPAAGRLLPNPNFRQPGPKYHALVVKGYTKSQIITNDPGTRKGKDFLYFPEPLMNAIHEWNSEDILLGRKAMIIVKPG